MYKAKERLPDPIFWINTDKECYPNNHPEDKNGSPFFRYWIPSQRAYVTPKATTPRQYDGILATIEQGDHIVAYENEVGIVAMGVVKEKPSLDPYTITQNLYPSPNEIIKSFEVEWDTSIALPTKKISCFTKNFRGTLRMRDDDFLYMLRESSEHWLKDEEYLREEAIANKLNAIAKSQSLMPKLKKALIDARIGHGRFRTNLYHVEKQCRITGVSRRRHLIASHIKPWVLCEGDEHWDGDNGLLLAPHLDHLFDKGMISFENDGNLLISRYLERFVLQKWALPESLNVGPFNVRQCRYLKFHRESIFEKRRPLRNLLSQTQLRLDAFNEK